MNLRFKNARLALLALLLNAAPVYAADSFQAYNLNATTVLGANVSGTLLFDTTQNLFVAPSFATVTGELSSNPSLINGSPASIWNGFYGSISNASISVTTNPLPLYVNLQNSIQYNLYLEFNQGSNGQLSLSGNSDVGFSNLKDHIDISLSTLTAVPEPTESALLLTGLCLVGIIVVRHSLERSVMSVC